MFYQSRRKNIFSMIIWRKWELNGLLITEMWLKDNKENDKIWMHCSLFNSGDDYKISVVIRPGITKGGGLALIHRNISVEDGTGDGQRSFKYEIWKLSIKNKKVILVGVYCPPDLTTVNEFHDFLDFVGNLRLKYRNLVILGDFNIHINNMDSEDAHQFLQTMEAMLLKQKVEYPTHIKGNILDVVFMDEFKADYKPKDICIGDLILDHYLLSLVLNIKDYDSTLGFKNFRNFKRASVKEIIGDMNLSDCNGNSLDEVLTSLNNNVQKSLNIHQKKSKVLS